MKNIVLLCAVLALTGCTGANISSQFRESGNDGSNMMVRCVNVNTGVRMNSKLEKYDGWKMIYVSEYTTANKSSTAAVMCFERPFGNAM